MSYKNVHFYQMIYFEKEQVKPGKAESEQKVKFFTQEELKLKIEELISNESSGNCLILEKGYNQITLEILSNTNEYIFARIGRMQDIRRVHLRNKETLKAEPIQKKINQEIEIFTYLIISKKNMVIAYITEQGAPHIRKFNRITDYHLDDYEHIEVHPVVVPDALKVLKGKEKITKMDYTIALPTEELLDKDHLNLPIDDFINLKDVKTATIKITVTGQKEKNIVQNISENIEKIVTAIKGSKNGETKSISFNAKNEGEYTHSYNIFDEYFVRKTKMNTLQLDKKISTLDNASDDYLDKVQKLVHDEIKNKLISTYKENEFDLVQYARS